MSKLKLLFLFLLLAALTACHKDADNWHTLKDLYDSYKDGKISECMYNGNKVYSCAINAYDAGSVIYNEDGDQIAICNYAWGGVDAMCDDLTNCEVIYCCEDNIWGEQQVDKYGLGH
jgi:hypothetical protein